jgi:hypothetical protein
MNQVVKRPDSPLMRDAIFRLESFLENLPGAGCEEAGIEWVHRFTPGVYAREMIVPAGVMLTGAIHKTEHISIFLEGRMIIPDEEGGSREIVAPIIEIAKPGIKRVGLAVERVRWITIHPTEETDVDVIEEQICTNDFAEVEHLIDQQDYESLGVSNELLECLRGVEVHKGDVEGLEIRLSKRHGMGLFATNHIDSGAIIAPMIDGGRLMEYSRYCNHSQTPNAYPDHKTPGQCDLVALRDIENEEITVDYRVNLRRLK